MSVRWAPSFLLPLLLIGCSVSPYQYGKQALEMGDYQRAIPSLQDAVRAVPENPHTWRELGIAYYRLGEYAEALANLERAYHMNPVNAKAVLYLVDDYRK